MPGIIDGPRWLRERIAYLEEALSGDPSPEQRADLEDELARAKDELRRSSRWGRWLLWGARR